MRKLYLVSTPILFCISILLFILCKIVNVPDLIHTLSMCSWVLFCAFAFLCIFLKGTLKKSLLSIFIYIAAIVIFVGSSFKMQHWPNGDLLISIGAIGISFFYLIHFLLKTKKYLLDWIKLIYVCLVVARLAIDFMAMPEVIVLSWASFIFGIVLTAVFYWYEWKNINSDSQKQIDIASSGENLFVYDDEIKDS